jgi:hypothetical protein
MQGRAVVTDRKVRPDGNKREEPGRREAIKIAFEEQARKFE